MGRVSSVPSECFAWPVALVSSINHLDDKEGARSSCLFTSRFAASQWRWDRLATRRSFLASCLQCLLVSLILLSLSSGADLRSLLFPSSPQPRHQLPLPSSHRALPASEHHSLRACCDGLLPTQHLPNDHSQPPQFSPPSSHLLSPRLRLQHHGLLLLRHQ